MKRIPMTYLAGLFVPVLVASLAWADTAADLKQADEHYQAGRYAEAEAAYQSVLNQADPNKPEDTERAFQAQKKLPVVYLATDRATQAQTAVQDLLVRHSDHARLPHAVHEIVEQAKELDKTLQAGQIYQNLLTAQPQQPQTLWLKMGMAIANAYLENDAAVDAVLQDIISTHGTDERAAEALGQTAWAYRKLEQHEKARTLYQYVVDNWPDKDRAIFSQRGIILCSLAAEDQEAADAATEQLLQRFGEDKNMGKVAWTVAKVYRDRKDWQRTRPLCQYILDNHGETGDAISAQQALIFAAIDERDPNGVQTGIRNLLANFSSDKRIPSAAYGTARKLNRKDDAQARGLYQYILDKHPGHEYVPFAWVNLGQIKLRQGDEAAAETIYQKVLSDYANAPRLAEAVHLMAEGYYERALTERKQALEADSAEDMLKAIADGPPEVAVQHFQKAMARWGLIINQLPERPYTTAAAYHFTGACYECMRQYDKALPCYQAVVERWPDYEYAWHVQYLIGHIYEYLKESEAVPASEADPRIQAAYEQLVARYPDCRAAAPARSWLRLHAEAQKGGEK